MMTLTKQDLKESAAIERRRRFEEERKSRIFNPRIRTIGVDRAALEKQVIERKCREKEEEDIEKAWEQQRIRDSEYAISLHKKLEADKRFINEEINLFSATYQQKETRREFDLYDPDALKKQIPPRIHDDDPRCGVSSGQKFDGEDLASKTRLKYQQEQFRSWVEQQRQEKKRADALRSAYDLQYNKILVARDSRSVQIEELQNDIKRKLNATVLHFNMALANDKEHLKHLEASKELEMNNTEVSNALTGDFLTENQNAQVSALGAHRVITYSYKGMSPEQVLEVRKEQEQQIEEKKTKDKLESVQESEWNAIANDAALWASQINSNREKLRQERENQVQVNRELMANKLRQDNLNRIESSTNTSDTFIDTFNNSTR